MTAKRIEAVLRPGSLAIVGASVVPDSIGALLVRNVREGGFRGPVYYVNRRHATLGDSPAYPDVAALPQAVDLAIIATPAATVPQVLEDCGRRGVKGAVVVSAGFRE